MFICANRTNVTSFAIISIIEHVRLVCKVCKSIIHRCEIVNVYVKPEDILSRKARIIINKKNNE